jgi:OOP family OmpA-OmpF porin
MIYFKRPIFFGIAIIFLSFTFNSWAEMTPGSFNFSPSIGGYVFEGNQNLDNGPTFGLVGGYSFDKILGAEAVFHYINSESNSGGGDVNGFLYRLDGLYHFMPEKRLVPYLAAGIGGITLDPDSGGNDTDFLVNYGGGLKYFLTKRLVLRGDVRHVIPFDKRQNNLAYTLMLTFLAKKEKKASPPVDSDGDGVPDHRDQCPGTPKGVQVDAKGCPLDSDGDGVADHLDRCPHTPKGVTVNNHGCPLDTDADGDGVTDDLDQCPDTPRGVAVDTKGCPLDSDADGVPDHLDRCPATPRGAKVNENGCWVLEQVRFDTGKQDIRPESFPALDRVADVLKQNPNVRVVIEGHTDNVGRKTYNQKLSENRAQAVMEYVLQKGIGAERLSFVGYGISKPIASNETAKGRARNRRVQLTPIHR